MVTVSVHPSHVTATPKQSGGQSVSPSPPPLAFRLVCCDLFLPLRPLAPLCPAWPRRPSLTAAKNGGVCSLGLVALHCSEHLAIDCDVVIR